MSHVYKILPILVNFWQHTMLHMKANGLYKENGNVWMIQHRQPVLMIHPLKKEVMILWSDPLTSVLLTMDVIDQEEEPSNTYQGGVFIVHKEDVRYALSLDQHVWEIWLTNPEQRYNTYDGMKRSFLTLWVSEGMGEELGRRGKLMVANKDSDIQKSACQ